jgi:phage terminase large subunit-like protein
VVRNVTVPSVPVVRKVTVPSVPRRVKATVPGDCLPGKAAVARLRKASPRVRRLALEALPEADRRAFDAHWPAWTHEGQLPDRDDWRQWVVLAGRGFGKTRAGSEWVSAMAREHPGAAIALVGATVDEARAVMVENARSGLLAVARAEERGAMIWQPSRRRLVFASGAEAFLYSAANPESLRGPEHHFAWCDELAKWKRGAAAWNNLRLGLRLGERPRAVVTTTPRPVPLLRRLVADPHSVLSGGPSWGNPHSSDDYIAAVREEHEGTRFGRQELEGVLFEDVEFALWPRELIEKSRVVLGTVTFTRGGDRGTVTFPHGGTHSGDGGGKSDCPLQGVRKSDCPLTRVLIGVDPPASAEGDACGIVVVGLGADGIGYVLADLSVAGLSPEGWARKVAAAAGIWGADRVIAEKNNGGEMVGTVLRGADVALPVRLVHAADGKAARAEPVAVLFESGKAKLAGRFPELEDELAGMTYGGGYQGPGRSPDRADAMVWALTELLVRPRCRTPRVRML